MKKIIIISALCLFWLVPLAQAVETKITYLPDSATAGRLIKEQGLGANDKTLAQIPVGLVSNNDEIDSDLDGLTDQLETALGINPLLADSDSDGHPDGTEIQNNYSPLNKTEIKLKFNPALANKLKGKILLQVQGRGEAWYINPADGKRYYLKNADTAKQIINYLNETKTVTNRPAENKPTVTPGFKVLPNYQPTTPEPVPSTQPTPNKPVTPTPTAPSQPISNPQPTNPEGSLFQISGTVTNSVTGQPIPETGIAVANFSNHTKTDINGRYSLTFQQYELTGLTKLEIYVPKNTYYDASDSQIISLNTKSATVNFSVKPLEVYFHPNQKVVYPTVIYTAGETGLKIHILDAVTGQPIPDIGIFRTYTAGTTSNRTDNNGEVTLHPTVGAGRFYLQNDAIYFQEKTTLYHINIVTGYFAETTIKINISDSDLKGTVTDAQTGKPLAGASIVVSHSSRWAKADDQGKYTLKLTGLRPGEKLTIYALKDVYDSTAGKLNHYFSGNREIIVGTDTLVDLKCTIVK